MRVFVGRGMEGERGLTRRDLCIVVLQLELQWNVVGLDGLAAHLDMTLLCPGLLIADAAHWCIGGVSDERNGRALEHDIIRTRQSVNFSLPVRPACRLDK